MPDLEYQVLMESLKNWNFQTLLKNHKKCYKTVFYSLPYFTSAELLYLVLLRPWASVCLYVCVQQKWMLVHSVPENYISFIYNCPNMTALTLNIHPQLTVVESYHAIAVYNSFKMAKSRNMNDVHRLIMGQWWELQSKRTHIWIPLSGVPEQAVVPWWERLE